MTAPEDTELLERLENPMAMGVEPIRTMREAAATIRRLQGENEELKRVCEERMEDANRAVEQAETAQSQLSDARELLERHNTALDTLLKWCRKEREKVLVSSVHTADGGRKTALEEMERVIGIQRGFIDLKSRTTPETEEA